MFRRKNVKENRYIEKWKWRLLDSLWINEELQNGYGKIQNCFRRKRNYELDYQIICWILNRRKAIWKSQLQNRRERMENRRMEENIKFKIRARSILSFTNKFIR